MSREMYSTGGQNQRSPKPPRREMPMVGQGSPSKAYPGMVTQDRSRGSPITSRTLSPSQSRKGRHAPPGGTRSSNSSPLTLPSEGHVPHSLSGSAFNVGGGGYYVDDLGSPLVDNRAASAPGHHRSRSVGRAALRSYHSLDRDPEREFVPIRDPRDRSLERMDQAPQYTQQHHHRTTAGGLGQDRVGHRDALIYDEDPYLMRDPPSIGRTSRQSPNPHGISGPSTQNVSNRLDRVDRDRDRERERDREAYVFDLQTQLTELQKEYNSLKKELEVTNQKLGSSMHSIKTFWSPELKKERAFRKEESAKYSLINDQLKLLNSENQVQWAVTKTLEIGDARQRP